MKHTKNILIIFTLAFLAFSNSLFNGFVGDDEVVIVRNSFYRSWDNFPRLAHHDYLTETADVFFGAADDYNSAGVSYRPVSAATFFVDYSLWKLNPFGYHLLSVAGHAVNAVLVYLLLCCFLPPSTALLAALIFCVNPTKSEAVCAISYRSDIIATFFGLLTFLLYIYSESRTRVRCIIMRIVASIVFLLGLFAKESIIVLPFLIIGYEFILRRPGSKDEIAKVLRANAGFIIVVAAYIFIYLKVFSNTTLGTVPLLGGTVGVHILTIIKIFSIYAASFVLPLAVNIIPPLYAPPVGMSDPATIAAILFFALYCIMMARMFSRQKIVAFGMFWFLISVVPVSNIIPLANPMAHRFLYLPSIGMAFVLAVMFEKIGSIKKVTAVLPEARKIVVLLFLVTCLIVTCSLNFYWKSNYAFATAMVRDYPQYYKGHVILGMHYYKIGQCEKAKPLFERALKLGAFDPRLQYLLGRCSKNEPKEAEKYFLEAIRLYPKYSTPYFALGKLYAQQGDFTHAVKYFQKYVAISPSKKSYAYLIKALIEAKNFIAPVFIIDDARKKLKDDAVVSDLLKIYEEESSKYLKK